LHRDDIARQAGLTATVNFDQTQDRVNVAVKRADGSAVTGTLTLTLVHATRSGFDNVVKLSPTETGYTGKLPTLRSGKWNVLLEDKEKQWRLQQEVNVGTAALAPLTLRAASTGTSAATKLTDAP